jgi:hypothetical protein
MKSIFLAAGFTLALALIVTLTFRASPEARRAGTMLNVFLGLLPVLVVVWTITPDDLGFLPPALLAEPRWFDLAACLFFYAAAFGGGVLQLYNLADRGLSLRILADLAAADRAMTVEGIATQYGGGRGIAWMYDKRLEGLTLQGFVVVSDGQVSLTARGRRWAGWLGGLRRFLRLPQP